MEAKSIKKCDGKMEIFSRVVGYYRPVEFWNKGKKEEYYLRKTFKLEKEEEVKKKKSEEVSIFAEI